MNNAYNETKKTFYKYYNHYDKDIIWNQIESLFRLEYPVRIK